MMMMMMMVMMPQQGMQCSQVCRPRDRILMQRRSRRRRRRRRVRMSPRSSSILRRPKVRRVHGPYDPAKYFSKVPRRQRVNKGMGNEWGIGGTMHVPLRRVEVMLAVHHSFLVRFERDDVSTRSTTTTTVRVLARQTRHRPPSLF
jgi:hypothetical protein